MRAFISFSSVDRHLARRVAELLRARGVSVWIDEGELAPGASLSTSLSSAIDNIEMFVCVLTSNTPSSDWVGRELAMAVARKNTVQIVPLRFDDTDVPAVLDGIVWGDCRTPLGLFSAVNFALRESGLKFPLSERAVAQRFSERAPLEFAIRLVPTRDLGTHAWLGASARQYVFVGDYVEQLGRSLRQILSNLWFGDAFDRVQSANLHWTAIVFEIGEGNRRKLDLMPGTWKAIFRILSADNRLARFKASASEIQQLGRSPRDYQQGDQRYWYDQITSRRNRVELEQVIEEQLGLSWFCFDGSGLTRGLGTTVASRVFLTRNLPLEGLNCHLQHMGHTNDGVTLV